MTENITLRLLQERVMWNQLFTFSMVLFFTSLVIIPFSLKWGMFVIFVIIGTWSKVPGWIHFSMNKMMITDLFTYIIALYDGFLPALSYVLITMVIGLYMGPKAWPLYVLRENAALTVAALIIAIFPFSLMVGFYAFLIVHYAVYYFLVLVFSADEVLTEVLILPTVIFFDFILTAKGLGIFQPSIEGLMTGNYLSGWPFVLLIGVTLGIIKYGKKMILKRNNDSIPNYS